MPALPLRDMVVYPNMVLPLFVGRPKSVAALNAAMDDGKMIFLVAQKNGSDEDPTPDDLHEVGTISEIMQVLKLPDGTVKVLVEGKQRASVRGIADNGEYFESDLVAMQEVVAEPADQEALHRTLLSQFDQYVKADKKIPAEVLASIHEIDDNSRMTDTVAAHLQLKLDQRQKLLELADVGERMEFLLAQIEGELEIAQLEKRIRAKSNAKWTKTSAITI